METKKIALACFIGGAICVAIALIMAPYFWCLGLLAGFGAGYLSYEFKDVLQAIPKAWQIAKKGTQGMMSKWFGKTHPFFYLSILFGTLATYCLIPQTYSHLDFLDFLAVLLLFLAASSLCGLVWLITSAEAGVWEDGLTFKDPFEPPVRNVSYILSGGVVPGYELTYSNLIRWCCKGTKVTAIRIFRRLILFPHFVWTLFKLIHSQKRVLCGVDGALGGGITFWMIHSQPLPIASQVLAIFFGGMLGAMFGVLNWEIVSKRLLHVQIKN